LFKLKNKDKYTITIKELKLKKRISFMETSKG